MAGGHWFGLQVVAWSGMLINYSSEVGLVEAVDQTFDGQHPCGLCVAIKTAQEETPELPATVNLRPLTAVLLSADIQERFRNGLPKGVDFPLPTDENAEARSIRPASPPPRV